MFLFWALIRTLVWNYALVLFTTALECTLTYELVIANFGNGLTVLKIDPPGAPDPAITVPATGAVDWTLAWTVYVATGYSCPGFWTWIPSVFVNGKTYTRAAGPGTITLPTGGTTLKEIITGISLTPQFARIVRVPYDLAYLSRNLLSKIR